MLTGKEWTYDDIMSGNVTVMLTSCGVATDMTEKHELVVENSSVVRRLTLSESVMWHGLVFDALELGQCLERYYRSGRNLGVTLDYAVSVISVLARDDFICLGMETDRSDALFTMFCNGFLSLALEQSQVIRKGMRCTMYYERFLHWDQVEQSPCRDDPLTPEEQQALDMLTAEYWSPAELARNLEKGYDSSLNRFMIPHEKYGILSLDPYADLVRMNYERRPIARKTADILLKLLRGRRVILY